MHDSQIAWAKLTVPFQVRSNGLYYMMGKTIHGLQTSSATTNKPHAHARGPMPPRAPDGTRRQLFSPTRRCAETRMPDCFRRTLCQLLEPAVARVAPGPKRIVAAVDRFNTGVGKLTSWLAIPMMLSVMYEVVMRNVFWRRPSGMDAYP